MKKEYTAYRDIMMMIRDTAVAFDRVDFRREGAKRRCNVSKRVIVNWK
jgi:hypothetical protein